MSEAHAGGGIGSTVCHDVAAAARGAADWLGLAAAPTFAVMALVSAPGVESQFLCSAPHLAAPLGGMAPMYLLMSVFHSRPWLRLASRA